jgi:hypothetical protein
MTNRKTLFLCLLTTLFLAACGGGGSSGDNSQSMPDQPGKIPGFGETSGHPQGTPFSLPAGVSLVGEIRGALPSLGGSSSAIEAVEGMGGYDPFTYKYAPVNGVFDAQVGNGRQGSIKFRLLNKNTAATKVIFPARLVAVARLNPAYGTKFTSGVLLKEASVVIPPGTEYTVILVMYSGNEKAMLSFGDAVYDFAVVSSSNTLKDLTDRLSKKRINAEESKEIYYIYLVSDLSDLLYNLTDRGKPLSDSDKAWIDSLPDSSAPEIYMPPVLPRSTP